MDERAGLTWVFKMRRKTGRFTVDAVCAFQFDVDGKGHRLVFKDVSELAKHLAEQGEFPDIQQLPDEPSIPQDWEDLDPHEWGALRAAVKRLSKRR